MNYKLWAILLLTVLFLYNLFLKLVRRKAADNPIPDSVADIYDTDTFARWREYQSEKLRLSIWRSIANYLITLALFLLNGYAAFAKLFPDNTYLQLFAVLLLDSLVSLLLIPFDYYDTMRIEEKYGFNRTTKKTFIADVIREFLIGLALSFGLMCAFVALHLALGDKVVFVFAGVLAVFILFVSFFSPFLMRIGNKFVPLEDGELKDKLTKLLTDNGYSVRKIEVMDGSRRSTKSNAFFTGFGKLKTIVLFDTLIEKMTPDEICAVFAHELGHGLHKDTLKLQILNFAQFAILALFLWLTARNPEISKSFGFEGVNYGMVMVLVFSVEYALFSPLWSLIGNAVSRKAEYRADAQAEKEGYGEALVSALKTLGRENFSELAPAKITVALEYNHPPLNQRIDAIRALESKKE